MGDGRASGVTLAECTGRAVFVGDGVRADAAKAILMRRLMQQHKLQVMPGGVISVPLDKPELVELLVSCGCTHEPDAARVHMLTATEVNGTYVHALNATIRKSMTHGGKIVDAETMPNGKWVDTVCVDNAHCEVWGGRVIRHTRHVDPQEQLVRLHEIPFDRGSLVFLPASGLIVDMRDR